MGAVMEQMPEDKGSVGAEERATENAVIAKAIASQTRHYDRSERKTRWLILVMIALLVVTAGFAGKAWLALRSVMSRQLKDAELQDAASISIQNLTISDFPDHPVVNFDVVNSGRTRADRVTMEPAQSWSWGHNVKGLLDRANPYQAHTAAADLGFSIEPAQAPRHFSIPLADIPPSISSMDPEDAAKKPSKDDFSAGRVIMLVFVVGSYMDVFGESHNIVDCMVYLGTNFTSCFAGSQH